MISLTIKDTKTFMSHLLIKDTFDNMLLSEAAIVTATPIISMVQSTVLFSLMMSWLHWPARHIRSGLR